ncbi:hypothetical protein NBT05_03310 [Aquimarina sp. ERC-38]|uniref:hypothetical protein n=1 Tax=Aquimarina sp. ERC-38 TaxID=2949996 RepID=UPI0022460683|nr:hypothetical protein [Aquimarina sp. ERC-38]UZO81509.1 hypothetical protein NBT05_03310 [Aquimarina sp. ERC-38]
MKKLIIIPAVILGLLSYTSTSAQDALADSGDTTEVALQDEYTSVAVEEVPQPVLDAVAKDFLGAQVTAIGALEDKSEFKITLTKEDGESVDVYADAEGNWITKDE